MPVRVAGDAGGAVTYEILQGDCIEVLKTLPANSVQCVVTSPPYYGLRDYGTAQWEGGSAECDHKEATARNDGGRVNTNGFHGSARHDSDKGAMNYRDLCGKCGARRIDSQIGLEQTPEEYVAKLVDVFREVWRVLRDDGTVWLNLGDSYATNGAKQTGRNDANRRGTWGHFGDGEYIEAHAEGVRRKVNIDYGVKPKDLIGIPWRVAFALQADGWWLRSDIIWAKPSPMPESVRDRPTKSHEYIFLLSKSASYFYDADAIKEALSPTASYGGTYRTVTKMDDSRNDKGTFNAIGKTILPDPNGRNRRSVWTVSTKPYAGAHFATFPPDLIEPCILAGTSARGCCAQCGAPWARVIETEKGIPASFNGSSFTRGKTYDARVPLAAVGQGERTISRQTIDWQPTCACNADVVPCIVLDPFAGSGTTLAVALKHGRNAIGCELNSEYIELAHKRIGESQPMLLAGVL